MWEDSVVKEVRQHRLAIEAGAGNDWQTILACAVEAQHRFASHLISDPSLSVVSSPDAVEAGDVEDFRAF